MSRIKLDGKDYISCDVCVLLLNKRDVNKWIRKVRFHHPAGSKPDEWFYCENHKNTNPLGRGEGRI